MARTVLPTSCSAQRPAEPDRLPDMQAPTRNATRAPASAIGGIGNRRGNRLDNQAYNSDVRFAIGNRQKTELPVMERWSLMPAPSPQAHCLDKRKQYVKLFNSFFCGFRAQSGATDKAVPALAM